MSVFPDWREYAAPQRRRATGCISTAHEMMLRAAHAKDVSLDTFQEDFDLGRAHNHFGSIANAIRDRYPHVEFSHREFPAGQGAEKLALIEERLTPMQC